MEREPRIWLVQMRKEQNLSQQELADKAAISRNYLSEVENGVKDPSVEVAMRLGDALGCDWTLFFAHLRRESQHTA